jgi:ferredoxin
MLYFSGTGNSKYIAELFCRHTNAQCHSVEEKIDFDKLIASNDKIAFCYPVYASRVPRIMREFVRNHIEPLRNKKIIIFCTQMYFSGDGARAFIDIFPVNFIEVIYAEHFLMPNNVNNLFITPLANEKSVKKYIDKAEQKMKTVCGEIKAGIIRKRGFNPVSRVLGLPQGSIFPTFEKMGIDKVWIDKDCTRCNLCVELCPMGNFEDKDGKIVTKANCMMCYRCINKCPQKAIAVFLKGKVKTQYKGI